MDQYNFPGADRSGSGDGLTGIDLAGSGSDSSSASTIYDPAAEAVDPKMMADLEEKRAEKERKKELGIPDAERRDLGSSPHSPSPGQDPFAEKIASMNADIGNEAPRFCCGLFALRRCVFAVNIMAIIVGVVSSGIGIVGKIQGSKLNVDGFKTLDALLLSGPGYIFLACAVGGFIFVVAGILGIVLANEITYGIVDAKQKGMFFVYQSFLVLLVFVFGILFGGSIAANSMLSAKSVYDESAWRTSLLAAPDAACDTELFEKCAGFADSTECVADKSTVFVQQKNCPGHFCLDFCQAGETIPNANQICQVCKPEYDWKACKTHEVSLEAGTGCSAPINASAENQYLGAVTILLAGVITGILCICLACFRACCLAPVE